MQTNPTHDTQELGASRRFPERLAPARYSPFPRARFASRVIEARGRLAVKRGARCLAAILGTPKAGKIRQWHEGTLAVTR